MNLPSDDSGDESERDSDVEDIEQQPVQENEESEESEEESRRGRVEQRNVFSERVSSTGAAMTIRTLRGAFLQLIDEWSIRHMVNCTKDRASRAGNKRFELDEEFGEIYRYFISWSSKQPERISV